MNPNPTFDPLLAQVRANEARDDARHPEPAPTHERISIPEIAAEREREQRTGTVRVNQRGHLRPDDRVS